MPRKVPTPHVGVVAPEVQAKDPIAFVDPALVKSDPERRLSRTPWGPGIINYRYYAGAAVPWKMWKIKGYDPRPDAVKARNEEFKKIAISLKGTKGVAVGTISGTDSKGRKYVKTITAPKIAFEIARRLGKSVDYMAEASSVMELAGKVAPEKAAAIAVVA